MDILHIETEASRLRIKLLKTIPPRNKLFFLYSFFNILLEEKDRNIAESYLLEFGSQYFDLISKIELEGVKPELAEEIIRHSKQVLNLSPSENRSYPESCISALEEKYEKLKADLAGTEDQVVCTCLPLLQQQSEKFEEDYGVLSTLSVQVKPLKDENKFHIIPGRGEPDKQLKEQAENSLVNAVRIAGKFTKIRHKYWDVYIDFENKSGEYSGASFGVLLVMKLVEEILRFYDSPTKVNSSSSAALTGAVNNDGSVPALTEDIVSVKTKIVFFSGIRQLVIPEEDFIYARNTLNELRTEFPQRNLKLIGIQSADDLFDLRNVVNIKRESPLVRTGKFIKHQALALFLLIPLTAIIIFSGVLDFDNNPDHFEYKGKVGFIMNKSGKKLFETKLSLDYGNQLYYGWINSSGMILDMDDDGSNEIILATHIQTIKGSDYHSSGLVCLDKDLNVKWRYTFKKSVATEFEHHSVQYDINLEDTLTINGTLNVFCIARNTPNEVSAIFRLDCRTGKLTNDLLWHSGHLNTTKIFSYNNKKELYATAINNGFERTVIFSIPTEKLNGQMPAAEGYEFLNIEPADPDQYVLLPKTDYNDYLKIRFNVPVPGTLFLDKGKDEILIFVVEGNPGGEYGGVSYRFTKDLKLLSVGFSDGLIEKRDALVREGKIKGPLTRTKEFEQSLISQLRYWDGKKFVTAAERFDPSR